MFIYFLTIDKVKLDGSPTKRTLLDVRDAICRVGDLKIFNPYQVFCFESKFKGKLHGYYLHYHCLLRSSKSFISYLLLAQPGYSIKLIKLITSIDVANTAGYIQKLKIDFCDLEEITKTLQKPEV